MEAKLEQNPTTNTNFVLSIDRNGYVLYSNEADDSLLNEWGVYVGGKLPSHIGDIAQKVISRNSPEKTDIKVGNKVYLVVFSPLPEQECVIICGFDKSDQTELGEKVHEREVRKMSDVELAKIIDVQVIQSLMDDFYRLVQIPMSLVDLRSNVLVGVGWQDICTKFHRINPKTCNNCIESSTTLLEDVLHGEYKLYKCKNNMWHIATPIIVDGQHVGNIISGQFFFDDEPLNYELFRSQAKKYGFNQKEYIAALEKVPRLSRKAVDTGMSFFIKLANLISQLSYSNIKLIQSLVERDTLMEDIKKSDERFRSILENSLDSAYRCDLQNNYFDFMSPVIEKITGFSPDEIKAMTITDFFDRIHPDDLSKVISGITQSLNEGFGTHEYRFKCKNGKYNWLADHFSIIKDKTGMNRFRAGIVRDITEQKRAEEALRESEERFRSAFDDSSIAMALVYPDTRLMKVNDAFCRLLGFEKSELEGSTFIDLTYPDDIELSIKIHKAVINREKSFFWLEKRYISKDGRVIWCEVSSSPVFDSKGIPIYTVAHIQDITERKLVERVLLESEEKYRIVADNTYDWEFWLDPDGHFLYMSPSCERVTGYAVWEFMDKPDLLQEIIHPDDRQAYLQHQHDNLLSRHGDIEFRIVTKDGETRWIHHMCQPVYDGEGRYTGSRGSNRDITERKEAEEALKKAHNTLEEKVKERTVELEEAYISLKESEERLSEAQRIAHLGNYDNDLVSDKLYWSDELYRIFGLQPQEGMTFNKFLSYIHPDDKDYVNKAVIEAINGKHYAINYRIIRPDGQERIVHSEREAIFDKTNKPIRAKGTIQDITEQKKSEEKIQNLANIVESSNDAIVTVSLDSIVTSWNKGAEQIFGYTAEEILGKKATILEPDNLRGEIKQLVDQVKQGKKIKHYESSRLKKDNTIVIISGILSPVFNKSGKLIAISVIVRDITDRKRTEEAMAKIEIARKQEIHHRIKNNLQVISSLLDLQAEKFNGKKSIKDSEVMESFRESQDRVISIALIHEELHKGEEIDTLNFSQYIEELADNLLLTYRLGNEGINLFMDIEENIFFDMDTAVPLGIIVNELLSNSLKYAFADRENGEIQIKLHRDEGKRTAYVLSVADNGIGIPKDLDIENLDSLGLQLVTTLVEQLDGELQLKRDNGTEFIIRFIVTGNNDQELTQDQLKIADNDYSGAS